VLPNLVYPLYPPAATPQRGTVQARG
jgi:hypothetical protein